MKKKLEHKIILLEPLKIVKSDLLEIEEYLDSFNKYYFYSIEINNEEYYCKSINNFKKIIKSFTINLYIYFKKRRSKSKDIVYIVMTGLPYIIYPKDISSENYSIVKQIEKIIINKKTFLTHRINEKLVLFSFTLLYLCFLLSNFLTNYKIFNIIFFFTGFLLAPISLFSNTIGFKIKIFLTENKLKVFLLKYYHYLLLIIYLLALSYLIYFFYS